jgi:hypothetical protein
MSNVEAFCAQQGNVLSKPLKFEGRLVKLDPSDNVCRQLHEKWMRSGGRQMMYAEFKKRLRFKSTDDVVSVWLSWDSTPVLVAGLSGLGAAGITTAAVYRYKAWQKANANKPSAVVECTGYETWDDVPFDLQAPAFEYSIDLKNVPAHLLMVYRMDTTIPAHDLDRAAVVIFEQMSTGNVVTKVQLESFVQSLEAFEHSPDYSYIIRHDLKDWSTRLKHWDLRLSPFRVQQPVESDIKTRHVPQGQRILKCGTRDISASEFDSIETQVNQSSSFGGNRILTFESGIVKELTDPRIQCVLHAPKQSRFAVKKDEGMQTNYSGSGGQKHTTLDLIDENLSENQLFSKRVEHIIRPHAKSMISYKSLVDIKYDPKEGENHLVFFLENPHDLKKVTFTCYEVTLKNSKGLSSSFALNFVAFRNGYSSDVAVLIDKQWIFYSGPDPQNFEQQQLRKMVPQNNLDYVCAVPYLLIFTKQ